MSFENQAPAAVRDQLAAEDPKVLDVRSVEEFESGHLPGAYNIPLLFRTPHGMAPNPAFLAAVQRHFRPEERLVLVWKAGGRSRRACELLVEAGYTGLVNMLGGMHGAHDESGAVVEAGWAACGYEQTVDAPPERTWAHLSGS